MNRVEKTGKKIVKVIDGGIDIILLSVLLLLFCFGCYSMWDTSVVYEEASSAKYEIYSPQDSDKYPSFEDLQKINPEVISWLTLNDTKIDYPVTQGKDNKKYINTDAFGEYSLTGSIFLDADNSKDFADFNSIIYGHHMDKEVLFGGLGRFNNEEYFNNHPYGRLYINGKYKGLTFFAFVKANAYDSYLYRVNVRDKEDYLNYIYKKAKYTRDIKVSAQDNIVLLSTCSSETTNGRYILVAKITDKVHLGEKDNSSKKDGCWILRWMKIIIPILIILILLILLLLRKKRKKEQ